MYEGKLVRLRAYREDDAPKAQAFLNDAETRSYLSDAYPFPYTLDEEKKWVAARSGYSTNEYSFAIETLKDGRYIGGCGVHSIQARNRRVRVGIFIGDKDYWGHGYGSDAMSLLLKFAFEEMNMHRVELKVFAYNPRAIRCYEKLGFVHEGRTRESAFHQGQYHDDLTMGILEHEWRARNPIRPVHS